MVLVPQVKVHWRCLTLGAFDNVSSKVMRLAAEVRCPGERLEESWRITIQKTLLFATHDIEQQISDYNYLTTHTQCIYYKLPYPLEVFDGFLYSVYCSYRVTFWGAIITHILKLGHFFTLPLLIVLMGAQKTHTLYTVILLKQRNSTYCNTWWRHHI